MIKKWISVFMTCVLAVSLCTVSVSATTTDGLFEYEVSKDGTACITAYNEPFTDSITALVVPREIDGYTVTKIGDGAFLRAFYLRTLILPDTLKVIGRGAFQESGIKQYFLPEGLEEIGENAFYWCSVEKLVIPSTVTTFGEQAFGFTCKTAYEENGEPIIPGLPALDEDFVLYVQENDAAVAFAEENGVAYRYLSDMGVGDVDLDGTITTTDARTALLFIVDGFTGNWVTGDMNKDGQLGTVDVREMIQYVLM